MHQIGFRGKINGTLEIKEKDLGSEIRNFSVRIACKIHTQGWRSIGKAALLMYENYICQYKAILLQCERDFDLMINVRLYQEIVVPYFTVKHGQFAAVALTRSGANKMLRKTWEAFILRRDRILLREHQKILADQRKFDTQLKNA